MRLSLGVFGAMDFFVIYYCMGVLFVLIIYDRVECISDCAISKKKCQKPLCLSLRFRPRSGDCSRSPPGVPHTDVARYALRSTMCQCDAKMPATQRAALLLLEPHSREVLETPGRCFGRN